MLSLHFMTRCRVMIMIFSFLFSWNITNVSYDHFVVNFVHTVTLFLFHMSIDIFLVRRNVSRTLGARLLQWVYVFQFKFHYFVMY